MEFLFAVTILLLSLALATGFGSESVLSSSLTTPRAASLSLAQTTRNNADNRISSSLLPKNVRFRCGRPDDEPIIAISMAKEFMNPLGISHRNFVVAEDSSSGERLGWAQIRPLGPAGVDPNTLNSAPGSIKTWTVDDEVDDTMWDEFEEDPDTADFTTWRATLPWSKEYKTAMEASKKRQDRRAELVEAEKARRKQEPRLWELASVYVVPNRRSEGIGRALVRSVLDQHAIDYGRSKERVYALTLSSTVDWYATNFGFETIEDSQKIPGPMAFEVAAGTAITSLMGNKLVCLELPLQVLATAGSKAK